MKLSAETISILRNFSQIYPSIFISKGNRLRTISIEENIFAEAQVVETFDSEFAIYDLNKFVSALGLHDNPDLDFSDPYYAIISDGTRTSKYYFADPDVIKYPKGNMTFPSEDFSFILNTKDLEKIVKASNTYRIFDLVVSGDGQNVNLIVKDKNNPSSNEFSITVGHTDQVFNFYFRMENLKIIPGEYNVTISKSLNSRFSNTKIPLTYYILLETDSTYED